MRETLQQPPPGAAELPTAEGLLQRRLKHLDLGLAVLCWLVGAGLALSGLIRALQADGQPNNSLLVLAAGVAVLLLAARGGAGRWLQGLQRRGGLRRLQALAWQIPTALIVLFVLFRLQVQDLRRYGQMFAEGSVAEWLTFVIFMVGSPIALACGKASWRRRERLRAGHHLLYGLGCLVVALEEMSWGQMVFNWPTPELLNEHNAQHETSLHNLHLLQDHLWSGTALVFAAALALTLLRLLLARSGRLRPHSLLADLLPGPELLPCLLFAVAIYIPVAIEKGGLNLPLLITRDQEVAELAFGLACLIYACRLYLEQPRRWLRALQPGPTG